MLQFLPIVHVMDFDDHAVKECIDKLNDLSFYWGKEQPIVIRIDSFGGSIYGLSALYSAIKCLDNPIITYCDGKAMSAGGLLLACAAPKGARFCSPQASIMIHEVQAHAQGDIKDILNNVDNLKKENEKWMSMLATAMELKNSDELKLLFKKHSNGHELFLSPEEAKKLKIIDEIAYIEVRSKQFCEIILKDDSKKQESETKEKSSLVEKQKSKQKSKKK